MGKLSRSEFIIIDNDFFLANLIKLFDLVFGLKHRLRIGLPLLLIRLHHTRQVALVRLHRLRTVLVYRVHRNSQVNLLLHLRIPVLWGSHLDLRHDLHGRLHDLDWKRHTVSFTKLIPRIVLHETLESVGNLNQLALHTCAEGPQHGQLIWVNINAVLLLSIEHRNVDQEFSLY